MVKVKGINNADQCEKESQKLKVVHGLLDYFILQQHRVHGNG
jgi:hypothetical protein